MYKMGIIVIIAFSLLGGILHSQSVSRQVLVPLATVSFVDGYCVSQTIGEPVVKYIRTEALELTQGFQQPSVSEDLRPPNPLGQGVKVYPNPVYDILTVEMFGSESTEYQISFYGLNGALYFKNDYSCVGQFWDIRTLNLSTYKRGTYIMKVATSDGSISRIFKVEKL